MTKSQAIDQLGMEEEIVFFLLQTVAPRHQLRSAFMRNSIRGWVYLETTMNKDLIRHLRLSLGIVHRNTDIIWEQVDFEDWTKLLSQHDSHTNSNLAVGDWVWVHKGTYKGDVGYVAAVENWGGISLLLVPRLPGPRHPGSSLSKRKCSTPPEPNLFEPLAIKCIYGIDPVHLGFHVYCFNRYTFEHGLILKAFDLRSVSSTSVHISTQLLYLYQRADHPALATATFPKPSEWHFTEGEVVWERRSSQKCIIEVVGDTFAEVEFRMKEGTMQVSLSNLLKEFHPGEFVEVMGGQFRGQSGWVEGGWSNIVHIAIESSSDDATEICDIKVGPFLMVST
jgi:transcription antitermination factor NusG